MSRTLVIGEPGATHEGDKAKLLRLLETAHACGASCFKPQWVSDPIQMLERRHIGRDHPKRAFYERAYSWLQFLAEWHAEFRERCHALGMEYACSVYLPQDVATIAPLVDYLKISGFEVLDAELRRAAVDAVGFERVIASVSMDSWKNITGTFPSKLLHCVQCYPTPPDSLHLAVLRGEDTGISSGCAFNGLSDHSDPSFTWVGALAVAAGATIVEAHYRLDDCDPENPDFPVARSPRQFEDYIRHIRFAEACLGTPQKQLQPCEDWALPYRVTR